MKKKTWLMAAAVAALLLSILLSVLMIRYLIELTRLPVLDVMTQTDGEGEAVYDYSEIYVKRWNRDKYRHRNVKEFTPDDASIYDVDCSGIESFIIKGEIRNNVNSVIISDENGNAVNDETLREIVYVTALSLDHDIYEFEIIKDGGQYFVFVKLNVNWHSPCNLYKYVGRGEDVSVDKDDVAYANPHIEFVYGWENVNIAGIKLPERGK